jgi:hypothetical protein
MPALVRAPSGLGDEGPPTAFFLYHFNGIENP